MCAPMNRKHLTLVEIAIPSVMVLLLLFAGPLVSIQNALAWGGSSGTTNLKHLGNKLNNLSGNSGVFYGNVETCADLSPCIGTNHDDIIYGGIGDTVFGLNGNDIVFAGLNGKVYTGSGNNIVTLGVGNTLAVGGSGDNTFFGGTGSAILAGGSGNDKLFGGIGGTTIMSGGRGANHFDCPAASVVGLSDSVVLDYNPANGDTIAGACKIVNTVGNPNGLPSSGIPDSIKHLVNPSFLR
jgi:Ca2+-binding RTX toxin-like protein